MGKERTATGMAEYIDREAAIKIAESYGLKNGSAFGRHSGIADCIAEAISIIPSADVAQVRHGRWLTWEEQFPGEKPRRSNNLGVFCDKCHNHADNRTDFCPHCGAKMDGGATNAQT